MNSGVRRASGNIIAFLDSDDFMHADRVERVCAAFAGAREVEWLRHDMTVVDEAGRSLGESLYPAHRPGTPLADIIAFGDTWGATSGLCFSRALFEEIGPIPEETYRYSGDSYLIVAGVLVGKCLTLGESLSARRLHSKQITNRRRPTPGYVRGLIRMRAHVASTASRLAADRPEAARIKQGAAWWQRKAALHRCGSMASPFMRDSVPGVITPLACSGASYRRGRRSPLSCATLPWRLRLSGRSKLSGGGPMTGDQCSAIGGRGQTRRRGEP